MKQIPLRPTSLEVLTTVAKHSPQKPLGVDDIRKRVRILDALEKLNGSDALLLEDAEHQVLAEAIQAFPWSMASAELLTVIDDVLDAKAP